MSLFRNTSSVLITSIAAAALGLLSSIILARYLTLEDRGYLGVAMTIAGLLTIVGNFGWPSAAIFRLRRVGAAPADVAGSTLWAGSVISLLLVSICLLNRDYISNEFLTDAPPLLFLLALALYPLQLLGNYVTGIARGIDRFDIHNSYRLLVAVGRTTLVAVALIWLSGDAVTAILAILLTYGAALIIAAFKTLRYTGLRPSFNPAELAPTVRFGFKGWIHALAGNIHERADILMLSSAYLFGNHEQLALYIQAVAILQFVKLVPNAIGSALLPHLAGINLNRAADETTRVLRHGNFWILLTVLLLAIIAGWLIPTMFGEQYTGAVLPFLILLPGVAFQSTYQILTKFWVAINLQRVNIITQAIAMPLNIALNFLLIPKLGITGAALASLVTYTVEGIAVAIIFSRFASKSFAEMFLIRKSDLEHYKTIVVERLRFKRTQS